LYEAASARMALPTEDYSWRPRVAMIVQLFGLFALGGFGLRPAASGFTIDGGDWLCLAVLIIGAGAFGMAMEADAAGPARRRAFSLLAPGALSGLRLTMVLLAVTTVLAGLAMDPLHLPLVVAMPSYLVIYLCAALWATRGLRMRKRVSPDTTRFAFIAISGLGLLAPWVVTKAIAGDYPARFLPGLVSPAVGLIEFGRPGASVAGGAGHWILLSLALFAFFVTDSMLARRRRLASATATAVPSKPQSDRRDAAPV